MTYLGMVDELTIKIRLGARFEGRTGPSLKPQIALLQQRSCDAELRMFNR
jgi:hypothetical protein